jgi:hypothetical protein
MENRYLQISLECARKMWKELNNLVYYERGSRAMVELTRSSTAIEQFLKETLLLTFTKEELENDKENTNPDTN